MAEQNQDASLEAKEITEAALEQLIAHIKVALSGKADKNGNKVLSTNDFTDEEKSKLAELYNYDDTEITALLNNKVDKADGKELSSNDFTDAYKDKIDGIETNADVNTIESITVNGTEITPDANKNVALTVITNSVNNLLNYYLKSETYTKEEVNALVNAIKTVTFEAVNELPTADIKTNVIYLVPKTSSKNKNAKDEYINLDGTTEGWELIGDTAVDLTGYVTESMLNTALADYTTTENLTTLLDNKVDKVEGKGLSTNDYTDEDKEKLNSLSNYDDTSLSGRVTTVEDTLDNKVDKVEGKDLSTNDYTDDEKTKLAGLSNYDDTALANRVANIEDVINNTGATSLITPAMIDSLWESAFENGDDKQW